MASINIAIKREAYEFLSEFKGNDRSFSDVILSFKKDNKDIMRFFGVLKDSDWEKKEEAIKSFRKSFNNRMR